MHMHPCISSSLRITPALGYSVFDMEITSDDGAGPQEVSTCGGSCRFIVRYTPGIEKIVPRNVTLLVGEKLCH